MGKSTASPHLTTNRTPGSECTVVSRFRLRRVDCFCIANLGSRSRFSLKRYTYQRAAAYGCEKMTLGLDQFPPPRWTAASGRDEAYLIYAYW